MDRFQTTIGPKPVAGAMTFGRPTSMPAVSHPAAVDYGTLSKLIEKQVGRANGHHVKGFQNQLNQFVFDLRKQFDRMGEENQRLLKTLEDLQHGQDYLLQQLELHQKREELAILREQQDGKRIRELENRLSLLLFAPIQNQSITIETPELRRFAIPQPELLEKTEEPQKVQGITLTPSEDGQTAETAPGEPDSGVADTFSECESPCTTPLSSAAEEEGSSTDEFETVGEVPPLETQAADTAVASVNGGPPNQLDEEPLGQTPETTAAVDETSEIIDLLDEVVETHQEEDDWLSDTAVSEPAMFDVEASEDIEVDESVESSSLNTNFVLQDPRGVMMDAEPADPEAAEAEEELDTIITLQDEISEDRPDDDSPSIDGTNDDGGQDVEDLSNGSYSETPLSGVADVISPDGPVAIGVEESLETVAEADTNSLEIIELKEDAIVGSSENGAAKTVAELPHEPAKVPAEESVAEASGEPVVARETEFVLTEQRREPADAKVFFNRGKLACQRKDYAGAIDFFNRYLELSPDDPRGPYNLAILHYRLKDYTRASANARKALDLGYTAADRIMAKIKSKSTSEAESGIAAEKSVSDAGLETETLHNLSLPEATAGSEENRETAAHRDDGKSPDKDLQLTREAVLEDNLFEPSTDESSCDTPGLPLSDGTASNEAAGVMAAQIPFAAVPEEPGDSAAAKQLFVDGMAAYQNKEYRPAVEHFRRYVALIPDEPKGHYNLAILHYRLKEYETAFDCAKRAQDLGAESTQRILQKIESKIARQHSSDEMKNAVDAAQEPFEDQMGFPVTQIDGSTGVEDTASIWDSDELGEEINQSLFSEATEENENKKNDDLILFDSPALDDKDCAEDEASGSIATAPDEGDPDQFFQNERLKNIFKLGQTAVENKEYLKAIQHFTKVTHLAPQDPRGYYHLAEVSFHLRFYETAREHATRAIELGSAAAKNILSQISALQVPA